MFFLFFFQYSKAMNTFHEILSSIYFLSAIITSKIWLKDQMFCYFKATTHIVFELTIDIHFLQFADYFLSSNWIGRLTDMLYRSKRRQFKLISGFSTGCGFTVIREITGPNSTMMTWYPINSTVCEVRKQTANEKHKIRMHKTI